MDKSIVPVNQIADRSSTDYEFSNSNGVEVVEIDDDDISVGTAEKQFNEKDVPEIFKTLIKDRMICLQSVNLDLDDLSCLLKIDDSRIRFERKDDNWTVTYKEVNKTIEVADPEKSIIDHLWFVLKDPNIKLKSLKFHCNEAENLHSQKMDVEKLDILLQSMLNSIDHQIQTNLLNCEGFNEDTFLSILEHVKPEILELIGFDISWKNEGNYQKMKEIVESEQWKQAKQICSSGVTPLKIDDLFQYKNFWLELDCITPEDVLRVVEQGFNSSCNRTCMLSCNNEKYDIDAIIDFLRSQNDGAEITEGIQIQTQYEYAYKIVKSAKCVCLIGHENHIGIKNNQDV